MSGIHQIQYTGFTTTTLLAPEPTSTNVKVYLIELNQDVDRRFIATVPKLPGVVTDGATEDDALDNVIDAVQVMLKSRELPQQFILLHVS